MSIRTIASHFSNEEGHTRELEVVRKNDEVFIYLTEDNQGQWADSKTTSIKFNNEADFRAFVLSLGVK